MEFSLEELKAQLTETLHPDLEPYLEETESLGLILKHPLVFSIPMFSNGYANEMYRQKTAALVSAAETKNWGSYIFLHERPHRLFAFQTIMHKLSNVEYWSLFAQVWTDTENQWQNKSAMKRLLNSKRKGREAMMTEDEIKLFVNLPDAVRIYRGCRKSLNENGMSWTLNREKARFFANRLGHGDGKILEAVVDRREIYAVFLGRGESEVVWYRRRRHT